MREITGLSSQKKKSDRINVFLDGEFAFGVDYSTAVKFGLKVGKTLDEDEERAIALEEGNISAFNRGLKYAVKKTVSKKQMRDYLLKVGYSAEATEAALAKLNEYGYADDRAYATAYVATYKDKLGPKRLRSELKNAGIDDEIIGECLPEDYGDACRGCVEKYLRTHKDADRQKLIRYLLYRGFEWDEINECIAFIGGDNED